MVEFAIVLNVRESSYEILSARMTDVQLVSFSPFLGLDSFLLVTVNAARACVAQLDSALDF